MKNGEAPIAMRITVRGQIAEVMIKRSTQIELWNQAKECSKGKDYKAKELNHYLETVKARIFKIQRELEMDGKVVTADVVKDRYYGRDVIRNQRTLVQTYSEHNERCRALIGIDFTKSTRHLAQLPQSLYQPRLPQGGRAANGDRWRIHSRAGLLYEDRS